VSDITLEDLIERTLSPTVLQERLDACSDRTLLLQAKLVMEERMTDVKQQLTNAAHRRANNLAIDDRWHSNALKAQAAIGMRISRICARLGVLKAVDNTNTLNGLRGVPVWVVFHDEKRPDDEFDDHLTVVTAATEAGAIREVVQEFTGQRVYSVTRIFSQEDLEHFKSIATKVLTSTEVANA